MNTSGRVIFITGLKGGVGKSTAAANLAASLCVLGKRVLAVDGDFGMRCLDMVLRFPEETLFDCYDVLLGRCKPSAAISARGGLAFMPAPMRCGGDQIPEGSVAAMFGELRGQYDFCIIDGAAEASEYFGLFAKAADEAVVVTSHQSTAIRAAEKTAITLADYGLTNMRLLLNGYRPEFERLGKLPPVLDAINRSTLRLLGVVPFDKSLPALQESGRTADILPPRERLKPYESAYMNIAMRLCGSHVPLFADIYKGRRKKYFINRCTEASGEQNLPLTGI